MLLNRNGTLFSLRFVGAVKDGVQLRLTWYLLVCFSVLSSEVETNTPGLKPYFLKMPQLQKSLHHLLCVLANVLLAHFSLSIHKSMSRASFPFEKVVPDLVSLHCQSELKIFYSLSISKVEDV